MHQPSDRVASLLTFRALVRQLSLSIIALRTEDCDIFSELFAEPIGNVRLLDVRGFSRGITCSINNSARLASQKERSGCSRPKAFSPIVIALANNGSASSYMAWKRGGKCAQSVAEASTPKRGGTKTLIDPGFQTSYA